MNSARQSRWLIAMLSVGCACPVSWAQAPSNASDQPGEQSHYLPPTNPEPVMPVAALASKSEEAVPTPPVAPSTAPSTGSCSAQAAGWRVRWRLGWADWKQRMHDWFLGKDEEFEAPPLGTSLYAFGNLQVANG